jgi:4-amino-4-deoxy-L-arabinose transferase-like glycosyltransferase
VLLKVFIWWYCVLPNGWASVCINQGIFVVRRLRDWLSKHFEIVALLAIIVLCVGIRLLFLHEPFERDEGSYAFVAKEILRGGIPYRDAIEMKPPGIFYLYALAIRLFGATVEGVRLFATLYVQLTLLCVFACARLLYGRQAGLLAAFCFALFSSVPMMQANSSNTETFLCLPLAAATLFMLKADQSGSRIYVWAGAFCAAMAVLIKTVAAPYIMVLAVFSFFACPRSSGRGARIGNVLGFVFVFCLVIGCAVVYFFFNGALYDLLLWNIIIPVKYVKGMTGGGYPLKLILSYLAPEYLALVFAALPAIWYGVAKQRTFGPALIVCLVLAVVAGICMPMKFFPHYFVQMLPFFCILAGGGITLILQMRPVGLWIWVVGISTSFGWLAYTEYPLYLRDSSEGVSLKKYGPVFVDAARVSEYIKSNTEPSDYVLQWGYEPEIYFLADRRSAVPYPNSSAIMVLDDVDAGIRNLVSNVMTKKPKYIILQEEWAQYPGYDELKRIILTSYHLEMDIGRDFYIFRLNGA